MVLRGVGMVGGGVGMVVRGGRGLQLPPLLQTGQARPGQARPGNPHTTHPQRCHRGVFGFDRCDRLLALAHTVGILAAAQLCGCA